MIRKFTLNDQEWTQETILEFRDEMIKLRDEVLKHNDFELAVKLSVNIGLLLTLAQNMEE